MASPRASRWPPPLLLLLLLLLLPPPAVPGTRGQPPSPALGAPLPGAGLARAPGSGPEREPERRGPAPPDPSQAAPGPGAATRRGRPGLAPRGASAVAVRHPWAESSAEPRIGNLTSYRHPEDFATVASGAGGMGQASRKSHAAPSGAPESPTLLTEAADAGGRRHSSGGTDFPVSPAGHPPDTATALTSQGNTSAWEGPPLPASSPGLAASPAPSRMEHGTSQGPRETRRRLPEAATAHTQVAASGVSSQSSLPAAETGESTTLSRKNSSSGLGLSHFSRTPASSPPSHLPSFSGSAEELTNSTALQSPVVSQTKRAHAAASTLTDGASRMLRSLAVSLRPVNETEGFPEDSKAATTSAAVHASPSVEQSRGNGSITRTPGDAGFTEPATENEFGHTSLHWRNDSPTFAERQLASSSELQNGSSPSAWQTEAVSRSSLGGGESTALWFLTHSKTSAGVTGSSASLPETVNTSVLTQFSGSAPRSGGSSTVLGDRSFSESPSTSSSESLNSSAPRGERSITGFSYGQASSTDTEQRTSSDHTDHTYVSSTFTKGERTLLSITDHSSSPDIQESSTSYVKISSSSHSGYPSSPRAQTERSNVSSYDGEYAQPSTESLALQTSNLPSYTSTVNVPNTLVLLNARSESAGGSSSSPSGSPLPLPSVSQSHQWFSSTLPSPRAPVYPLQSTSEASTPLSSSPSPLPLSFMASTPAPGSVSQTALPHSPSTAALPRVKETSVTPVQTPTGASSTAVLHSSHTADPANQSTPYQSQITTQSKSPSLVSLPTEPSKAVKIGSPSESPLPSALTESSTKQTILATNTNTAQKMSPGLTTTAPETAHPVTTLSTLSSTAVLIAGPAAVQTTTGKQLLPTHPETVVPQISTEGAIPTQRNQVHADATTRLAPLTSAPTSAKDLTTSLGVTEEDGPASHLLRTSPPQTTDLSTAETSTPRSATSAVESGTRPPPTFSSPAAVNRCATNPCLHGGKCIVEPTRRGHRCVCSPSWQGDDCSVDVNECLLNPCPPLALCNNTQGSYICRCPVGYQLEKGICNLVRTFVTEFKLKKTFLNTTVEKHSDLQEVQNEITRTLNMCFSTLPGYIRSTVHASRESSVVVISLQTTFALASNVTLFDLADGIQKYVNSCRSSAEVCQLLGSQRRIFRAGSLCKRKSPECDKETSICTDLDGVALCQCKSGYFQFNKMDHSCRACEDGYRLENETCMSCPFGLGGLNCGNPYQLITVVIAAAGGGLLLILGIALIVTCCRKNKNDISKLIFKSGDFQMSPYAEYPKNPRSQEWGREAIEMHENGSTKNLLQMTDVYYSPTNVRNPELERNGLYPAYTGLPGSRHSCIFPGQYNPSFISDESRRRDYF
ncbi:protein HEG homolog 1 [Lepus europaeus]|uniref:protein HEG homolog 1 n=1 Tax=Lepus europaeus TaxID=9983 RepID=UPI002B46291A|nr:protein HEG homolog 1 [Lepus europaeus]